VAAALPPARLPRGSPRRECGRFGYYYECLEAGFGWLEAHLAETIRGKNTFGYELSRDLVAIAENQAAADRLNILSITGNGNEPQQGKGREPHAWRFCVSGLEVASQFTMASGAGGPRQRRLRRDEVPGW
jgi:hypothetical protein